MDNFDKWLSKSKGVSPAPVPVPRGDLVRMVEHIENQIYDDIKKKLVDEMNIDLRVMWIIHSILHDRLDPLKTFDNIPRA